jgi:hypothetical protein
MVIEAIQMRKNEIASLNRKKKKSKQNWSG